MYSNAIFIIAPVLNQAHNSSQKFSILLSVVAILSTRDIIMIDHRGLLVNILSISNPSERYVLCFSSKWNLTITSELGWSCSFSIRGSWANCTWTTHQISVRWPSTLPPLLSSGLHVIWDKGTHMGTCQSRRPCGVHWPLIYAGILGESKAHYITRRPPELADIVFLCSW